MPFLSSISSTARTIGSYHFYSEPPTRERLRSHFLKYFSFALWLLFDLCVRLCNGIRCSQYPVDIVKVVGFAHHIEDCFVLRQVVCCSLSLSLVLSFSLPSFLTSSSRSLGARSQRYSQPTDHCSPCRRSGPPLASLQPLPDARHASPSSSEGCPRPAVCCGDFGTKKGTRNVCCFVE